MQVKSKNDKMVIEGFLNRLGQTVIMPYNVQNVFEYIYVHLTRGAHTFAQNHTYTLYMCVLPFLKFPFKRHFRASVFCDVPESLFIYNSY